MKAILRAGNQVTCVVHVKQNVHYKEIKDSAQDAQPSSPWTVDFMLQYQNYVYKKINVTLYHLLVCVKYSLVVRVYDWKVQLWTFVKTLPCLNENLRWFWYVVFRNMYITIYSLQRQINSQEEQNNVCLLRNKVLSYIKKCYNTLKL